MVVKRRMLGFFIKEMLSKFGKIFVFVLDID